MATRSKTTALANWDEELAKQAQIAAKMEEGVATGQFFSVKSGVLQWNDSPVKNNELGCIIIDAVLENVYYDSEYDKEKAVPPRCFAFAREKELLVPHQVVAEAGNAQHETCEGCKWNQFGTAGKGRGKACRNTRRLALLPAGTFAKDGSFETYTPEALGSAGVGYMRLPVTSVRAYSAYVKTLAAVLHRPTHGVLTRLVVEPDPDNQYRVVFEEMGKVPNELMATVMKRHEEVAALIEFPYGLPTDEPAPRGKGSRSAAPAKKQPVRRKY